MNSAYAYSPLGFSRYYIVPFFSTLDLFQTRPAYLALILRKDISDIFILIFLALLNAHFIRAYRSEEEALLCSSCS